MASKKAEKRINLTDEEKRKLICDYYSKSLTRLGLDNKLHIFEVPKLDLSEVEEKETLFLIKLSEFFKKLDFESKYLLVCEILEKGSYYPFWYVSFPQFQSKRNFLKMNSILIDKVYNEVVLKYA